MHNALQVLTCSIIKLGEKIQYCMDEARHLKDETKLKDILKKLPINLTFENEEEYPHVSY